MNPNSKLVSIVLVRIVSKYLESHKRLVIPQLGAFIVKEPGKVLFSELLKREDGVLRELFKAEGVSELEAAGEIDRFVFEIRHAVERGVGYPLRGFGLMKPGPGATIIFEYNPQQGVPVKSEQAAVSAPEPEPVASAKSATAPSAGQLESAAPTPPPHMRSEQDIQTAKTTGSGPEFPKFTKLTPEPYVKGLRYGKPPKNTNAYTYVGHSTRRWGIDRFLLVAVAAAVIAVAVIAFGYFRKSREQQREQQIEQLDTAVNQTEQPNQ